MHDKNDMLKYSLTEKSTWACFKCRSKKEKEPCKDSAIPLKIDEAFLKTFIGNNEYGNLNIKITKSSYFY